MKLKLIQTGGFMGKLMTAEEDLEGYPATLIRFIENVFREKSKKNNQPDKPGDSHSRDQFQYFVEFNNKRLPVEALESDLEFARLLSKLKEQLHY